VDYINEKFISYITGNGFKRFLLGIESGSQKILDMVNKKVTVDMIKNGISILNRYTSGGHIYSLMVGLPGEEKEDIRRTLELARWIYGVDKKAQITLNVYTPYPGVELTNILSKNGYPVPKTNSEWMKYNLFSIEAKNWISEKRLIKSLVNIFRLSFTPSGNMLARFLSRHAKNRFLKGELRPYPEFELSYYLARNF